jgi:hypothetical protein
MSSIVLVLIIVAVFLFFVPIPSIAFTQVGDCGPLVKPVPCTSDVHVSFSVEYCLGLGAVEFFASHPEYYDIVTTSTHRESGLYPCPWNTLWGTVPYP